MPDLTAAERAAAEVLAERHNARSDTEHLAVAAFAGEARAVVEAVRGIIEAETLRAESDALESGLPEESPTMLVVPAHLWLRDRAAARQPGEGQH